MRNVASIKMSSCFLAVMVVVSACIPAQQITPASYGQKDFTVSYRVFIAHPSLPEAIQRVWHKGSKQRIETDIEGKTSIVLIDSDQQTFFVYLPQQNIAMQTDFRAAARYPSAWSVLQSFLQSADTITASDGEIIAGRTTTRYVLADPTGDVIFWSWDEMQFPLKSEIETPQGTALTIWTDIDFSNIPDNQFSLPAGTQIINVALTELP